MKDARWFQIAFLSSFLLYGIFFLGWDADIPRYLITLASAVLAQILGARATGKSFSSIKSAVITALGLCLLLKTNSYWSASLGAALAIGSKFILKSNGKHIFNPANFGIVAAIILTGDAWISPGQWGSSFILVSFFGAAALMVLLKVGRIDSSLAFLLTFIALEYGRTILYLGWEHDVLLHKLTNGSLLLFTFFMITDPVTTPNAKKARVLWSVGLAIVSFCLTSWFYIHTAPLWALFFISPATVLLDKKFIHKPFKWIAS